MSRRFTPEERATLWRGWKSGLTLKAIGESLNRRGCSVLWVLRREGGFEPRTRIRAARTLQPEEREEISRGMAAGRSIREIARQLGRAPSTVAREIGRNGGAQGVEEGASGPPQAWRFHAPAAYSVRRPARDRRWHLDSSAASRSRGSGGSRPLGR